MIKQQPLKGFRDFLPPYLRELQKVAVFIDAANLEKSLQDLGWKMDYKKLKRVLSGSNQLVYLGYYSVSFDKSDHQDFLKSLMRKDYSLVIKPLKIIRGPQNTKVRKANFDVEIATDASLKIKEYQTFILFSGDSDFDYLVKEIRKRGIKTIVVSTKYHVSKELVYSAHRYIDLKKLKSLVRRQ